MPKRAKELTNVAVAALKEDGRYAVGGAGSEGLHLRVAGDSRAWVLRVKIGNRRCDVGLGSYPKPMSLAEARKAAFEIREKVRNGVDPLAERRAARTALAVEIAKAKTFKDCAEAYIDAHRAGWANPKHSAQWTSTLATYAYPVFGKLPVAAVTTGLILDAIRPIWATKTETASRLRGRIESVLDWAKVSGYRDGENPARWRGHLDKLLPARSKVQKIRHHAALPYADLGTFMADLRACDGVAPRALEFAILCGSRSSEVRGAMWSEVNLAGAVWTIPASRMKAKKEHRVPLSDTALTLLKALPRTRGCELVFVGQSKGGGLSENGMSKVLERMGRSDLTQHGFRSTFRDWAGETTAYPREVIEHALAHQLKDKAEAAYQRGDLLAKRARLMADWAAYCGQVVKQPSENNVVPMQGAA